ncbi:hypothetical protein L3Y34_009882 [Caenorhabditis briggsae]|uniref:Uncharacterized protein n=1 Tax=Caenorhabditis briggsae TaxID=6238 RepID=A0AAE9D2G2_CAEBR|nr:hypothetical protein L3Y34_009882 [Caenorhabditis briggsae]
MNSADFEKICSVQLCNTLLAGKATYLHQVTRNRICRPCWQYFKKHEIDRTFLLAKQMKKIQCSVELCDETVSPNSNLRHSETKKTICKKCHKYRKTHNLDRTVLLKSQMNNKSISIEDVHLEIRKRQKLAAETGENQKCTNPFCTDDAMMSCRLKFCKNCYEFFQKYKKFRSERAIKLMEKQKKTQEIVKEKPESPPRDRSRSPDEFPNLSLEKKMFLDDIIQAIRDEDYESDWSMSSR